MTTSSFEPLTVAVPLREEPAAVLRVGNTRVLLELVLDAYKRGESPEAIVRSYRSLRLTDVYAVITHYWPTRRPSTSISAAATKRPRRSAKSYRPPA